MTAEELVQRIAALVDEYNRDIASRLSAALAGGASTTTLPPPRSPIRSEIVRLYLEGNRPCDIARMIGRTQTTVNSLIYNARKRGELPPRGGSK